MTLVLPVVCQSVMISSPHSTATHPTQHIGYVYLSLFIHFANGTHRTSRSDSQFIRNLFVYYSCLLLLSPSPLVAPYPWQFYRSILFTVCIRQISIIQVNFTSHSIDCCDWYRFSQAKSNGRGNGAKKMKIQRKKILYFPDNMNPSVGLTLPMLVMVVQCVGVTFVFCGFRDDDVHARRHHVIFLNFLFLSPFRSVKMWNSIDGSTIDASPDEGQ